MYTKVVPFANTIGHFLLFILFLDLAVFESQVADSLMVREENSEVIEIVSRTFNKGGSEEVWIGACLQSDHYPSLRVLGYPESMGAQKREKSENRRKGTTKGNRYL